jgi:hypothetical protein
MLESHCVCGNGDGHRAAGGGSGAANPAQAGCPRAATKISLTEEAG